MYAFQVVEDEDGEQIEILHEEGVDCLLECFKKDFGSYVDFLNPKSKTTNVSWDSSNHENWDAFLSGLQELKYYTEFMSMFSSDLGDKQAEVDFAIATELIEDQEEIVTEILMFTAGNRLSTTHDFDSFKFWNEQLYNIIYIEQAISQCWKNLEVSP